MKFSRSIPALYLVGSSSAFVVQPLSTRSTSPWLSSREEEFDSAPGGENSGASKESISRTNAPGDMTAQGGEQRDSRGSKKGIWNTSETVTIQGGSLKTWSFSNYNNKSRNRRAGRL